VKPVSSHVVRDPLRSVAVTVADELATCSMQPLVLFPRPTIVVPWLFDPVVAMHHCWIAPPSCVAMPRPTAQFAAATSSAVELTAQKITSRSGSLALNPSAVRSTLTVPFALAGAVITPLRALTATAAVPSYRVGTWRMARRSGGVL
jgi:hypothetical protein